MTSPSHPIPVKGGLRSRPNPGLNTDGCFEVAGANPLKQLSVVVTRCLRSFHQERLRSLKPSIETVEFHVSLQRGAA